MQAKKVTATRAQLLDPLAPDWANIPGEPLKMDATPLANQPSEYIKASRNEKEVGKVRNLMVQSAHNGSDIFFRLTWEDPTKNMEITDNNIFPDGCGILAAERRPADRRWAARLPGQLVLAGRPERQGPQHLRPRARLDAVLQDVPDRDEVDVGQRGVGRRLCSPLAVPELKDEAVQLAVGTPVKIGRGKAEW
jgi:hypothetical protein